MSTKTVSYKEEKLLSPRSGFPVLIVSVLLFCAALAALIVACVFLEQKPSDWEYKTLAIVVCVVTGLYVCLGFPVLLAGLKVIHPNEAAVYTLFGSYYGTITKPGFFFINPFCTLFVPSPISPPVTTEAKNSQLNVQLQASLKRKVSLKAITLNNAKQKINDRDGNPIDIGVVVIWRVVSATKAVFEVDNYKEYVSIQADAAIRHIARQYPYDISEDGDETSLRGSATAVAEEMKRELQDRVAIAGLEILETRISHLAYAQEIAAAMLQRQQAAALIDARQKIVEGAVGMVEMALDKLAANNTVVLDDERKAAMVSNLLVVLCGSKEAQPIVNSGSLY